MPTDKNKETTKSTTKWDVYRGTNEPHTDINRLPKAPPWRKKGEEKDKTFTPTDDERDIVNTALCLRRPILITGEPGIGKSALAKSVAYELGLGKVLEWHITTQSVLKDALYSYDAVARLHDASLERTSKVVGRRRKRENIGKYITLGVIGTAFKSKTKRVILIDEIDKSSVDLPNNLLHVLEGNEFSITELVRSHISKHSVYTKDGSRVEIENGRVEVNFEDDVDNFPLIIMTSNGEREFPPAFMRRCIHLRMKPRRDIEELESIIKNHITNLSDEDMKNLKEIIEEFSMKDIESDYLAIDQLLNRVFMKLKKVDIKKDTLLYDAIWKALLV